MAKKKLTISDVESISVRELAFRIKEVDDYIGDPKADDASARRNPHLAFFLGAGASKDSGVILAGEMMQLFKSKIFEIHCHELPTDKEKNAWLKDQSWHKNGKDEYGCLFEKSYSTKSDRQRFIESICARNPLTGRSVEPSFGYLVLSDLLLRNYINTVITTNFDDLVYIASTTFTGNRPIVYAYGILASEMKVNSPHSKVLKLHGDYLYSNIVNTADEMHAQSNAVKNPIRDSREFISNLNMERQVRSVLDNFGLIVVGYSGGDKTIMDLLKDVSENNGFYWCYIKGYPPDTDVLELVQSKKGKLVEITGFDDLFKEIADITGFSVEKLLESFENRKDDLVKRITEFNQSFSRKPLNEYARELKKEKHSKNLSAGDYFVLAYEASDDGDSTLAEQYYLKAIELNPQYADAYNNLGLLLSEDENRKTEAEEHYRKAIELDPQEAVAYYNFGLFLSEDENRKTEAEEYYRKAIELNPQDANAYYNFGLFLSKDENRKTEAEEYYRKAIELDPQDAKTYNNLGVLLFKQDKIDEAKTVFETSAKIDENFPHPQLNLAGIYKRKGDFEESQKYAFKARDLLKDDDFYNLACLSAILEEKDEALKYLKLAVERDSSKKLLAKTDPDFDWIRDDERFQEIVGK